MNLLLDTNVMVALLQSRPSNINRRFEQAIFDEEKFFISQIVMFELLVGVNKSQRLERNLGNLTNLVEANMTVLDFTSEDAQAAARIRATLESRKLPIGPYDTLIAGQALAHNLTLVTSNTREFSRVEGLTLQDWSTA